MSLTGQRNERVSADFAERIIGEAVRPPWPWWGFVLAAALLSAVKVSWKDGDLSIALDVNGVTAALIALMWLPSVLRVIAWTGGSFKTAAGEASSGGFLSLIGGLAEGPQLLGTLGAALEDAERGTAGSQQKETAAALDAVREQLTSAAAKTGSPLQSELTRLAHEYESVRKVMPGGSSRTWQMSGLVEQAQAAVRASTDSDPWLRQWIAGFDNLDEGERVMALAVLRAYKFVPRASTL